MPRLCLALMLVALTNVAAAQLTEAERQGIKDALYVGNLRVSDLGFERKPFADPYRMGIVDRALDDPLGSADSLMALHAGSRGAGVAALLAQIVEDVYGQPLEAIQHDPPITGLEQLPDDLRQPVLVLMNWINSANNEIRRATRRLTPKEKRLLIESLPVWAVEEPAVEFSFVNGETVGQAEILELLAKVDLPRIRSAAARLAAAVEKTILRLKSVESDLPEMVRLHVGGMPVVIAGRGRDEHTDTDAILTIDLGGNDTYSGRHGAGVGYASVLIDLGGNDTYDVGDLNIGAAILGIGLAYDEGGHDTFRGGSIVFGAGLAGVGALSKRGGDDVYRSAKDFVHRLRQQADRVNDDIIVDTGLAPVSADTYGLVNMGLDATRMIRQDPDLDGIHLSVGLTNFSFGVPKDIRQGLENAYITLGLEAIPLK